jgi:hypothetical protein
VRVPEFVVQSAGNHGQSEGDSERLIMPALELPR